MILGNYSRQNLGSGVFTGGGHVALTPGNLMSGRSVGWLNFTQPDQSTTALDGAAMPTGYSNRAAFRLPIQGGEMSFAPVGAGSIAAGLVSGRTMILTITGSGDMSSTATLMLSMLAALVGSGSMSADGQGRLDASASLTGSGELTGSVTGLLGMLAALVGSGSMTADASGLLNASAALTGAGTLDGDMTLLANMLAALSGAGSLTADVNGRLDTSASLTGTSSLAGNMSADANMIAALTGSGGLAAVIAAIGNMSIEITVTGTGLSTANVGQAVWSALASLNNEPGSMGERMNDGASGGGPSAESIAAAVWALANGIEAGITPQQALRAILAKEVGSTSSLAGPGPITFNSPGGTPRVVLNVTDNRGNRAAPDLNL